MTEHVVRASNAPMAIIHRSLKKETENGKFAASIPRMVRTHRATSALSLHYVFPKGRCQWGDACRYLHVESSRSRSIPAPRIVLEPSPRSGSQKTSNSANNTPREEPFAQSERGVVSAVKESFGFIKFSSGKSLFYHKSNVQSSQTLREGDEVECDLVRVGGKEEAVNVRLLGGLAFLGGAAPKKSPPALAADPPRNPSPTSSAFV